MEYYDDKVFKERALKDFRNKVWPQLRKEKLQAYIPDANLLDKLFLFEDAVTKEEK